MDVYNCLYYYCQASNTYNYRPVPQFARPPLLPPPGPIPPRPAGPYRARGGHWRLRDEDSFPQRFDRPDPWRRYHLDDIYLPNYEDEAEFAIDGPYGGSFYNRRKHEWPRPPNRWPSGNRNRNVVLTKVPTVTKSLDKNRKYTETESDKVKAVLCDSSSVENSKPSAVEQSKIVTSTVADEEVLQISEENNTISIDGNGAKVSTIQRNDAVDVMVELEGAKGNEPKLCNNNSDTQSVTSMTCADESPKESANSAKNEIGQKTTKSISTEADALEVDTTQPPAVERSKPLRSPISQPFQSPQGRMPSVREVDSDEETIFLEDFITIDRIDTTRSYLSSSTVDLDDFIVTDVYTDTNSPPADDLKVVDMDVDALSPPKRKCDGDESTTAKKVKYDHLYADINSEKLLKEIDDVLKEDLGAPQCPRGARIRSKSLTEETDKESMGEHPTKSKSLDCVNTNQDCHLDVSTNLLLLLGGKNSPIRAKKNDIKAHMPIPHVPQIDPRTDPRLSNIGKQPDSLKTIKARKLPIENGHTPDQTPLVILSEYKKSFSNKNIPPEIALQKLILSPGKLQSRRTTFSDENDLHIKKMHRLFGSDSEPESEEAADSDRKKNYKRKSELDQSYKRPKKLFLDIGNRDTRCLETNRRHSEPVPSGTEPGKGKAFKSSEKKSRWDVNNFIKIDNGKPSASAECSKRKQTPVSVKKPNFAATANKPIQDKNRRQNKKSTVDTRRSATESRTTIEKSELAVIQRKSGKNTGTPTTVDNKNEKCDAKGNIIEKSVKTEQIPRQLAVRIVKDDWERTAKRAVVDKKDERRHAKELLENTVKTEPCTSRQLTKPTKAAKEISENMKNLEYKKENNKTVASKDDRRHAKVVLETEPKHRTMKEISQNAKAFTVDDKNIRSDAKPIKGNSSNTEAPIQLPIKTSKDKSENNVTATVQMKDDRRNTKEVMIGDDRSDTKSVKGNLENSSNRAEAPIKCLIKTTKDNLENNKTAPVDHKDNRRNAKEVRSDAKSEAPKKNSIKTTKDSENNKTATVDNKDDRRDAKEVRSDAKSIKSNLEKSNTEVHIQFPIKTKPASEIKDNSENNMRPVTVDNKNMVIGGDTGSSVNIEQATRPDKTGQYEVKTMVKDGAALSVRIASDFMRQPKVLLQNIDQQIPLKTVDRELAIKHPTEDFATEPIFVKGSLLSKDQFPVPQRSRCATVEEECCDKAVTLEQPDVRSSVEMVRKADPIRKTSLNVVISLKPTQDFYEVIDLTVQAGGNRPPNAEEGRGIDLGLDDADDGGEERITLYRSDETLNNSLEVQAMVASMAPSTVNKAKSEAMTTVVKKISDDTEQPAASPTAVFQNNVDYLTKLLVEKAVETAKDHKKQQNRELGVISPPKSTINLKYSPGTFISHGVVQDAPAEPVPNTHASLQTTPSINIADMNKHVPKEVPAKVGGQVGFVQQNPSQRPRAEDICFRVPQVSRRADDNALCAIVRIPGRAQQKIPLGFISQAPRCERAPTITDAIRQMTGEELSEVPPSDDFTPVANPRTEPDVSVQNKMTFLSMHPTQPTNVSRSSTIQSTEGTCPDESVSNMTFMSVLPAHRTAKDTGKQLRPSNMEIVSQTMPNQSPRRNSQSDNVPPSEPPALLDIHLHTLRSITAVLTRYICFYDHLKTAQNGYQAHIKKLGNVVPNMVAAEMQVFSGEARKKSHALSKCLAMDLAKYNMKGSLSHNDFSSLISRVHQMTTHVLCSYTLSWVYLMLESIMFLEAAEYMPVPFLRDLFLHVGRVANNLRDPSRKSGAISSREDALSPADRRLLEWQIEQYHRVRQTYSDKESREKISETLDAGRQSNEATDASPSAEKTPVKPRNSYSLRQMLLKNHTGGSKASSSAEHTSNNANVTSNSTQLHPTANGPSIAIPTRSYETVSASLVETSNSRGSAGSIMSKLTSHPNRNSNNAVGGTFFVSPPHGYVTVPTSPADSVNSWVSMSSRAGSSAVHQSNGHPSVGGTIFASPTRGYVTVPTSRAQSRVNTDPTPGSSAGPRSNNISTVGGASFASPARGYVPVPTSPADSANSWVSTHPRTDSSSVSESNSLLAVGGTSFASPTHGYVTVPTSPADSANSWVSTHSRTGSPPSVPQSNSRLTVGGTSFASPTHGYITIPNSHARAGNSFYNANSTTGNSAVPQSNCLPTVGGTISASPMHGYVTVPTYRADKTRLWVNSCSTSSDSGLPTVQAPLTVTVPRVNSGLPTSNAAAQCTGSSALESLRERVRSSNCPRPARDDSFKIRLPYARPYDMMVPPANATDHGNSAALNTNADVHNTPSAEITRGNVSGADEGASICSQPIDMPTDGTELNRPEIDNKLANSPPLLGEPVPPLATTTTQAGCQIIETTSSTKQPIADNTRATEQVALGPPPNYPEDRNQPVNEQGTSQPIAEPVNHREVTEQPIVKLPNSPEVSETADQAIIRPAGGAREGSPVVDVTAEGDGAVPQVKLEIGQMNAFEDGEVIDLTWMDEIDPEQLQNEIKYFEIKKEEDMTDTLQGDELLREEEYAPHSPADSGISSPPIQREYNEQVFLDRTCICGESAEYVCRCYSAMYCSIQCQRKHWATHREQCNKHKKDENQPQRDVGPNDKN